MSITWLTINFGVQFITLVIYIYTAPVDQTRCTPDLLILLYLLPRARDGIGVRVYLGHARAYEYDKSRRPSY